MSKILLACCFAALAITIAGCGGREYTGEKQYALSGTVSVDGQPMEHGLIRFLAEGKGRNCGGPITNGTYSITEPMGANAGKHRVEITWNKPTGRKVKDAYGDEIMDEYKEGLPEKYHKKSELTADVSAKQTKFDFPLTTK